MNFGEIKRAKHEPLWGSTMNKVMVVRDAGPNAFVALKPVTLVFVLEGKAMSFLSSGHQSGPGSFIGVLTEDLVDA